MSLKSHIILASASPRRVQLLAQLGIACECLPVEINETWRPPETAEVYVARLASDKALEAKRCKGAGAVVLAADTAVTFDGEIMGKPADRADAARMLAALSGATHQVFTGVALVTDEGEDICLDCSLVRFAPLDDEQIGRYLDTGEYCDKAGAYAIQGCAAAFIERLEGSYSGVMGLPLFVVWQMLARYGLLEKI